VADYGYVIADTLTDANVADIELQGVTFQRRIIIPGTLRATYPVTNRTEAERIRTLVPGRTVIHVFREADILGTFPVWQVDRDQDENGDIVASISAASLESYPYRRKIRADLPYLDDDQLAIARALLTHMQARPEGDIGLALGGGTSGVIRTRNYRASENSTYGERLEQLANVIDGFEYLIRTRLDGLGNRVREWIPGYPQLGGPAPQFDISQPGKITSFKIPDDATQAGTSWQTRGDTIDTDLSVDSEPLMSDVYEDAARLAAGWPLLDQTVDFSSVRLKSTLNSHAQVLRDSRSGSVSVPQLAVHFDDDFFIHPNLVGSYANLTLVNDLYPLNDDGEPTFAHMWRLIGMDYTPPTDDAGERASLICAGG
jgi:hypothetical protein